MAKEFQALIADTQELTRRGLKSFLEETELFKSIEYITSREELELKLKQTKAELLVIDFDMFEIEAISDIFKIINISPDTRILVVTENKNKEDIFRLKEAGIKNYLLKSSDLDELASAIQAVLSGKVYFSEEVLNIIIEAGTTSKETEKVKFTVSEIEIIKYISQGLTTKEIAAKKMLSQHTIITHRKNIFRKAKVTSTSELIMFAIRAGIVDVLEYYI
jgi:DNA-binding NarL/FixJ family response regulator